MKISFSLLMPMLLITAASACVVQSTPPPATDANPPVATPPGHAGPESTPSATTTVPPAGTPAPTASGAPTSSPAPSGTAAPAGAADKLVGAWTSPACGARTYVRTIQFDRAGSFESQDLVSPCPPKVQCIWSGIVNNKGTYAIGGNTIRLSVPQPTAAPKGQPLPTTLEIDPATSAPVELAGVARCVYAKGGATPQVEGSKPSPK